MWLVMCIVDDAHDGLFSLLLLLSERGLARRWFTFQFVRRPERSSSNLTIRSILNKVYDPISLGHTPAYERRLHADFRVIIGDFCKIVYSRLFGFFKGDFVRRVCAIAYDSIIFIIIVLCCVPHFISSFFFLPYALTFVFMFWLRIIHVLIHIM